MIHGHGDDAYQYPDIRVDFSSNIHAHADMSELKSHLCHNMDLIDHYPEPEPVRLEKAIADKYGIPSSCVLVTNGATEAIYLVAQALADSGIVHYDTGPHPTFSEYEDASRMSGLTPVSPDTSPGEGKDTVCWCCNPNNPTGHAVTPEAIRDLARKRAYLAVDQSYEDFTLIPMMTHREAALSENIIQIHSLTKTFAIPGLRVGYIISSPAHIRQLRRHVRPWSVNVLAIEAGKWLIANYANALPDLHSYLEETERLRLCLNQIEGIEAAPTHTHFMLATIDTATAAELKEYLAIRHHLLIRDASNFRGLTPHHFRISTQLPEENRQLVEAIADFGRHNVSL